MPAVSTARIVAQYLTLLIGAIIFVIALYWAIETWFQIQPGNSAMGILVIYAAALGAGNLWFRREPQPASGRLWRVALICGLLTVALQGAIMGLMLWAGVQLGEIALPRDEMPILAGVLAGLLVLEVLMIRVGLWQGLRQSAKAARLRADKAAR